MHKNGRRIEQEDEHSDDQDKRTGEWRYAELFAENETNESDRPEKTEHGSHFDEVLFGQMIARIELENEHVIHAGLSPAIDIDGNQE